MSLKKRVERLEERLNLGKKEKRVIVIYSISADADLPNFPYEDDKDCRSYQRQIKELEEKDADNEVWVVELFCEDCKEECKFMGLKIGAGRKAEVFSDKKVDVISAVPRPPRQIIPNTPTGEGEKSK